MSFFEETENIEPIMKFDLSPETQRRLGIIILIFTLIPVCTFYLLFAIKYSNSLFKQKIEKETEERLIEEIPDTSETKIEVLGNIEYINAQRINLAVNFSKQGEYHYDLYCIGNSSINVARDINVNKGLFYIPINFESCKEYNLFIFNNKELILNKVIHSNDNFSSPIIKFSQNLPSIHTVIENISFDINHLYFEDTELYFKINSNVIEKDFYSLTKNNEASNIIIDEEAFNYGFNNLEIGIRANKNYIDSTISTYIYREDPDFLYYFNPDNSYSSETPLGQLKFKKGLGWKSAFSDKILPENWWFANYNYYGLFRYYESEEVKCSYHNIIVTDFGNQEAYQEFLSYIYQHFGDVRIFVIPYNNYSKEMCIGKLKEVLKDAEYV